MWQVSKKAISAERKAALWGGAAQERRDQPGEVRALPSREVKQTRRTACKRHIVRCPAFGGRMDWQTTSVLSIATSPLYSFAKAALTEGHRLGL